MSGFSVRTTYSVKLMFNGGVKPDYCHILHAKQKQNFTNITCAWRNYIFLHLKRNSEMKASKKIFFSILKKKKVCKKKKGGGALRLDKYPVLQPTEFT